MPRVAVVGLGYVGLPVAVAMGRAFPGAVGLDTDPERIALLRSGTDETGSFTAEELARARLTFTSDPRELRAADFFIVAVPTPIDDQRRPDLRALEAACLTVGRALAPGDIVVFESTVYPGVTEEFCGPILARESGLRAGRDFKLGYSPERINPGDREHTFENIVKVVAAQDEATLEIIADTYGAVVDAGVFRAESIQVAEAAKAIENVQRDLNIALMNELAIIFDRLGIETRAVLDAAATKWNFQRYHPGLVGGHCIGVDPYYLTTKAEAVGLHPQVILAGRRINDGMGAFVASKTVKLLIQAERNVHGARVALLGITFKPDVADTRNSLVPDIARELKDYGVQVLCHDPLADPVKVVAEYGIELVEADALAELDAVVLATPHRELVPLARRLCLDGAAVFVDVLSAVKKEEVPDGVLDWRL